MWKWLGAGGLTALSVSLYTFFEAPYISPPHGSYPPGALTLSWLLLMVAASPTILFYRLLIFIGERLLPSRPVAGAMLALLAGAILPPLIHNALVSRALAPRNFQNPVRPPFDTIAIEDLHLDRDSLQAGFAHCNDTCLRLLFGQGARRVIVGDGAAQTDTSTRFSREASEPATYPTAYALRIERREICPPVASSVNGTRDAPFPGGPRIGPSVHRTLDPILEDRVIGLMASGHCLIAEPGRFLDADLRLGERSLEPRGTHSLVPDSVGLIAANFAFVDRRNGSTWTRLSQRVTLGWHANWTYPFAFLPQRRSLFAATMSRTLVLEDASEREQPWAWAGMTLPLPPYIGRERVRTLLGEALDLPPDAPRDARHLLARQYVDGLSRRGMGAADRALLYRVIADPRIPADALQPLQQIAERGDADMIGRRLVERIGRTDPENRDIRTLSYLVSKLPRHAWPAILPAVRRLAADPERAANAAELFDLFSAGNEGDAEALLALFRRDWPPVSLAGLTHPIPEHLRRARTASHDRVVAYLAGLCAVADKSRAIHPALIEASRAVPILGSFQGPSGGLWGTMARMGIDIERLAAERNASRAEREEISRLARQNRAACPKGVRRPGGGAVPAGDGSFSSSHASPRGLALALDALFLLIFILGTTAGLVLIAKRRARCLHPILPAVDPSTQTGSNAPLS